MLGKGRCGVHVAPKAHELCAESRGWGPGLTPLGLHVRLQPRAAPQERRRGETYRGGDTLRRMVGKFLLATDDAKDETRKLQPRQVGVGVPFAAELVGMGVQRLAEASKDTTWACLQVDVSNAFNFVSRPAMMKQCATINLQLASLGIRATMRTLLPR